MAVEKDKFLGLLDRFIERSEIWMKNAEAKKDCNAIFYYKGQKDVIEELKDMANNWK